MAGRFNPAEHRDAQGQWTSGPGGVPRHLTSTSERRRSAAASSDVSTSGPTVKHRGQEIGRVDAYHQNGSTAASGYHATDANGTPFPQVFDTKQEAVGALVLQHQSRLSSGTAHDPAAREGWARSGGGLQFKQDGLTAEVQPTAGGAKYAVKTRSGLVAESGTSSSVTQAQFDAEKAVKAQAAVPQGPQVLAPKPKRKKRKAWDGTTPYSRAQAAKVAGIPRP